MPLVAPQRRVRRGPGELGRTSRIARFFLFLGLIGVVAAGCSGRQSSGASATPSILPASGASPSLGLPPCRLPPKIAFPTWVPSDLPLPDGTYATEALPTTQGYNRGLFVVPVSLTDFARFILTEWPKKSWVLGRGESEEGEIEDQFTRGPAAGAIRARAQACDPGYLLLLLTYVPDRSKVASPSGASPASPSP